MIQKIKNLILAVSMLSLFAAPVFAPAAVTYAGSTPPPQQTGFNNNLCSGSNFDLTGKSTDCNDQGNNSVGNKVQTFLNILSAAVGLVAVAMIIYAGFRYVTSGGNEAGVKAAKNAIIYAVIGLVVVAIAQLIVHFVIHSVTG